MEECERVSSEALAKEDTLRRGVAEVNKGTTAVKPWGSTDQSAAKKRPAVVVSSATYQQQRPDIIVMAVTSQLTPLRGDIPLQDWRAAGLLKASVIKPVITTLAPALILKKLGRLQEADRIALREALTRWLG